MPTTYGVIERNGVNFSHDSAVSISYDNSNSGLTATEIQSAIDELKSSIPTGLDDLSDDATHRLVTDTEKNTWNRKQDTLTEGSNISIVNNTISATDHIYNTVTTASDGLCPTLPGTTTKYLRGDGTWVAPDGTVYTTATTAADGLLPTLSGTTATYLRGDGIWYTPPSGTTYANVSTASAGLAPKVTSTAAFLRGDATWQTTAAFNTTYGVMTSGTTGLVPSGGTNAKFLRGDATWQIPDNTTYAVMTSGTTGLVPSGGTNAKFLRGDATWVTPTDTTYPVMTSGTTGLVPSGGTNAKYLRGDATWQTPPNDNTTYAIMSSGTTGLVPSGGTNAKYLRGDATWQTPTNTTYGNATTSSAGLLGTADKIKLNGYPSTGNDTAKYLRNDGSWQVPPGNGEVLQTATADTVNDVYQVLYSAMTTTASISASTRKGGLAYVPFNRRLTIGQSYIYGKEQDMLFQASDETEYSVTLGVKDSDGNRWYFGCTFDNYLRLGLANHRWNQIYSSSATINTSDKNQKKDIESLDESAKDFIMALNPVSYKFKDGESGRTHYGMIAQDVEKEMSNLGMTAMDFAGLCKDQKTEMKDGKEKVVKGKYIYGLRYEEFIAPMIKTIQLQEDKINQLESKIDELESLIKKLK